MTVIIGIDPHKRSHTAVALDERDQVLDELRVKATDRQVRQLLKFARRWPDRIWAIENANGLGWFLSRQLVEHGEQVRDAPAALSAHPVVEAADLQRRLPHPARRRRGA